MSALDIAALADTVHERGVENTTKIYSTKDIEKLYPEALKGEVTGLVINYMSQMGLLKVMMQGGSRVVYKFVSREVAERQALLTPDERLLYSHIEASAGEGIWTKTLKARSNLHQTTINKCLKSLETKRFIKPIKSKQHPTRKIYMLYELTPSIEVTGGPWFTDGELDDEFVTELTSVLERYIHGRTFLKGTSTPYPPGYSGYATLESLTRWIKQAGVTEVDLSSEDVKSLLDCLVYDGRIEKVGGVYKAVRGAGGENASNNGFTESPCGRCPVFALCEEGGPVNAGNCVYYAEWLNAAI